MNLTLKRDEFREDGILGFLFDQDGKEIAHTLEHAYDAGLGNGAYAPKLPNGTYTCVKGLHKLHSSIVPFITYEITGVPGHTGILFHSGNVNDDSNGCVLMGDGQINMNGRAFLTVSRRTFSKFIDLLSNVNEFTLTVL